MLDEGFLPVFVGVFGWLTGALPAAGDGAMLFDVLAVCGVMDLLLLALGGGEDLFGVGGKE